MLLAAKNSPSERRPVLTALSSITSDSMAEIMISETTPQVQ
jgi:hypothetical protein